MERQAEPGLENSLNRDANQTIFLITFLFSMQATSSQETNNALQEVRIRSCDPLVDLGSRDLGGLAEIS